MRQTAIIDFARSEWNRQRLPVRVIAVRTRDRLSGKQLYLWEDNDYTVQVFLSNDFVSAPEDLAQKYNERAGIEPLIAEFKSAWGIGKVPSTNFVANHAALLLKLLAHNLLRRYVVEQFKQVPEMRSWRAPWLRRAGGQGGLDSSIGPVDRAGPHHRLLRRLWADEGAPQGLEHRRLR